MMNTIQRVQRIVSSSSYNIRKPPHYLRHVHTLQISKGSNEEKITSDVKELCNRGIKPWKVIPEQNGLEREFRFKSFKTTWKFMNNVAEKCITTKHHPEWSNKYNVTKIRWTTHVPQGISEKDVEMARYCDEIAVQHGEVTS